ncbi:aldehyde ferredoxin oxidoreductase [Acidaminobacter sp. JC074]|uniref:aldehyde ferredoxin oxidoreductase family protein n=1 Tax=Acidaminobacter sp. JC074 TaxID=2530199 RepID=UPI001F0D4D88|nr:aldehyde ferredoxin oxidoreductase family protein [Acidaminobacter sp. JC074]MCH4886500.1 aldehyde ferredoxin oxidoreductase [Acidaminobacter sp. JC074]
MKAYKNCELRINLKEKTINKKPLNQDYIQKYMGGEGYGMALMWDEMNHTIDPLDEANILSFNTGPLTGTPAPSASRTSVVFISPLTGSIGASNMGSRFGAELKFAGYDSIIFESASSEPVYLFVDDDKVSIEDAKDLWGKVTRETTDILKDRHGKDYKVVCIGPSGEKLNKLAAIFSDDCFAGRGGAGAVMGSKNLKAIVVKGTGSIDVAESEAFLQMTTKAIKELKSEAYTWGPVHAYGTPAWLDGANEFGLLPVDNFQKNKTDKLDPLLPANLWNDREKFDVKRRTCYACQIGCHKYVVMGDVEVGELEYETIAAFGPRCGVYDYQSIAMANYYTSIYGIDTISAGATVATAMEWYEKGIVTKEDLDGLELNFGNGQAMAELVRKMCLREGCGDLFADGSYWASKKLGEASKDHVMTVKGMEISATDPRGAVSMAIAFGTSERGACHMRPYAASIDGFGYIYPDLDINEPKDPFSEEESKEWLKAIKEYFVVTNLIGLCDFNVINTEMQPTTMASLYEHATGLKCDKRELLLKAERTIALERALNYDRGFRRKDDKLPKRFMKEPAYDGPPKGRTIDMDKALDMFYQACDFDLEKAIPTYAKYEKLGMKDIGQAIYMK